MGFKVSRTQIITVTPTIDTAAYVSGDQLGSIHTISGAFSGAENPHSVLLSLAIVDRANQKSALDLFLFDALPTLTSSDNAAIRITDAIMAANCVGYITVAATDYITCDATAGNAVAVKSALNLIVRNSALATNLYAVCVSRGTPTYAATSDLVFKYGFLLE